METFHASGRCGRNKNPTDFAASALTSRCSRKRAYEVRPRPGYGCEDPRVTYVPRARGLRDGLYRVWARRSAHSGRAIEGRVSLGAARTVHFAGSANVVGDDKDAAFFPEPVLSPEGRKSLAFYHRPMLHLSSVDGRAAIPMIERMPFEDRESIRIGYVPLEPVLKDRKNLCDVAESRPGPFSRRRMGMIKIGAGTPPVKIALDGTECGSRSSTASIPSVTRRGSLRFSIERGIVIHDLERPDQILYRSPEPILAPEIDGRAQRRRRQRRFSDRPRSASRPRRARVRHLLRHGRLRDRRRANDDRNSESVNEAGAQVPRDLDGDRFGRSDCRRRVGESRFDSHQDRFGLCARSAEAGRAAQLQRRPAGRFRRRRTLGALGTPRVSGASLEVERLSALRAGAIARGCRADRGPGAFDVRRLHDRDYGRRSLRVAGCRPVSDTAERRVLSGGRVARGYARE